MRDDLGTGTEHLASDPCERAEFLPDPVLHLLDSVLDPKLVAHRRGGKGQMVSYLEGYQAINQANRIFGYGRWGAELVGPVGYRELTRIHKGTGDVSTVGMYWAT